MLVISSERNFVRVAECFLRRGLIFCLGWVGAHMAIYIAVGHAGRRQLIGCQVLGAAINNEE